jgi:hypothetical protein
MTTSPYRMNPSLGPDLHQVVTSDDAWYEGAGRGAAGAGQAMSPQTGDQANGDDGRLYMWVEASGTIADAAAPGTQVSITDNGVAADPRFTAASGAGGWYAPPTTVYGTDILAGDRFWAAKGTVPGA